MSQSKCGISIRTIAEGEIGADDINCPVTEAKWVKSQLNHDTWACVILLSKKSYALTKVDSFWPDGKRSILPIGIRIEQTIFFEDLIKYTNNYLLNKNDIDELY